MGGERRRACSDCEEETATPSAQSSSTNLPTLMLSMALATEGAAEGGDTVAALIATHKQMQGLGGREE